MKQFDVLTIGSAFQDVYVFSKQFMVRRDEHAITGKLECFLFGTKIELDDILYEVGGGATNAAYTLRRQGFHVGCISRVGRDAAGGEVRSFLRTNHITDFSIIDSRNRTAQSVVFLGPEGERTLLVYRGASREFRADEIRESVLKRAKWLYVTSLAGNLHALRKVLTIARANGIGVMLNPGKLDIERSRTTLLTMLPQVHILLVNREEASEITGRPYSNISGILDDLAAHTRKIVLVTEGMHGSYAALNGKRYRVIINPVQAVDTTGAGDAFGSGFLAGYIASHGQFQNAVALGANAAAVVKVIGAKHGLLPKRRMRSYRGMAVREMH